MTAGRTPSSVIFTLMAFLNQAVYNSGWKYDKPFTGLLSTFYFPKDVYYRQMNLNLRIWEWLRLRNYPEPEPTPAMTVV